MRKFLFITFILCMTSNCFAIYAPVVDATTIEAIPKNGIHRVVRGETFYSIAWRYGLNYRTLALKNHIKSPYNIYVGEIIYLRKNPHVTTPTKEIIFAKLNFPMHQHISFWHWPARGRVIKGFSTFNKGINISGKEGDPVFAAADGKIVYNGNGLRGYGNLIIIKHNSQYLTAYAHNMRNIGKLGQWVKAGQKIAEMGNTGTNRVMLHFEIRKEGASVNPIRYLRT